MPSLIDIVIVALVLIFCWCFVENDLPDPDE